jgi:hypothetical protein
MRLNETVSPRENNTNTRIGEASRHKAAGNPRQVGSSSSGATGGALAAAFAKLKDKN